jgi:hypothetical protein
MRPHRVIDSNKQMLKFFFFFSSLRPNANYYLPKLTKSSKLPSTAPVLGGHILRGQSGGRGRGPVPAFR